MLLFKKIGLIVGLFSIVNAQAQTVDDLIATVDFDNIMLMVKELAGEQETIINGKKTIITHRSSSQGNDLAAEYLLEKLSSYSNLEIKDIKYSAKGRNVVAVQKGSINPDSIYIISAHYDTVTTHGADDNASGTATVLELARILSQQCIENTIVYALWDEEETGLVGANNYATAAKANGDKILAVYNIDMMAYDNNDDTIFDIDYNDSYGANGAAVKDDILEILNTYKFNLKAQIVPNSNAASDQKVFWEKGFPAVLVGESWETNDRLPNAYYHKEGDKTDLFNTPYFYELSKLAMAYMATKAKVVTINKNVTQVNEVLTAANNNATYQWYDCNTGTAIPEATEKTYIATKNGQYAVQIKEGNCTVKSNCYEVTTLNISDFNQAGFKLFPNPVTSKLTIELTDFNNAVLDVITINGKSIFKTNINKNRFTTNVSQLASGIYFVKLNIDGRIILEKIIKD